MDSESNGELRKLNERVSSLEREINELNKKVEIMSTAIFGDNALNPGVVGAIKEMRDAQSRQHELLRASIGESRKVIDDIEKSLALSKAQEEAMRSVNEENWRKIKLWGGVITFILALVTMLQTFGPFLLQLMQQTP